MNQFKANQKHIESAREEEDNKVNCPTCSSTDVKRISATAKVTNIALFGLLGNKRKCIFYCTNCKYE